MASSIERFHCKQDSQLSPDGVLYREVLLYMYTIGLQLWHCDIHTYVHTYVPFLLQEEVKFPSRMSEVGRTVLTGLLIKDPQRRLGGGPRDVQDVKTHPFFSSLNWQVSCGSHVTCMWPDQLSVMWYTCDMVSWLSCDVYCQPNPNHHLLPSLYNQKSSHRVHTQHTHSIPFPSCL